ncbi:Auxin-responsive protein IAA33 [Platanthera zijinensis]|uniref:Auxin-responsive protein n=1 Tax=Platanthera zijinensis TaxID=2320716 RepID=A0AAP0FVB7_9ASPA
MMAWQPSRQEQLKRRWEATSSAAAAGRSSHALPPLPKRFLTLSPPTAQDLPTGISPSVSVFLEGRSISHRVRLDRHASYDSLAATLRRMFVDAAAADDASPNSGLDLSNAVPGHMVAYEDVEDDLILAGDLSWKDFVRVAKRIRIIPAKPGRRKHGEGAGHESDH